MAVERDGLVGEGGRGEVGGSGSMAEIFRALLI